MARRVINEMTADEVDRHGGVKIGDFGCGRTYKYTHTRAQGGGGACQKIIFFAVFIGAGLTIYYNERNLSLVKGAIEEARGSTISYSNLEAISSREQTLVHAKTAMGQSPLIEASPLRDDFFGISSSPDDVMMRRHTEYCQWQETQHSRTISKGFKPDYCTQISRSDACDRVSCSSKGQGSCSSSECCAWRKGDEILETQYYYTYHKAWRDHRISSLTFDSPAAYYNPQRDPAPPKTYFHDSATVDLSGGELHGKSSLRVNAKDIVESLDPYRSKFIGSDSANSLSSQALAAGFSEISHEHFYSRVPKDGLEHPAVLAAAAYLVDGVVNINHIAQGTGIEGLLGRAGLDWITKGTCNAGDIRVSFEGRAVPSKLSVIGKQRSGIIEPHTYKNGLTKLLQAPTIAEVQELLDAVKGNTEWWTNVYRALIALVTVVGCGMTGFSVLPTYYPQSHGFILAVAIYCSITSAALFFFYQRDALSSPIMWVSLGVAVVSSSYLFMQRSSGKQKSI